MSRIGKKAVTVPTGVTANVEGQTVKVKGPKGALQLVLHDALRDQTRAFAVGHLSHVGQQPDGRCDQGLRGEA
jgi:ribosomal protein L6P/L9E